MRHHDSSYSCAQIPEAPRALSHPSQGQEGVLDQGHEGLALTQLLCDTEQALPSGSLRFSIGNGGVEQGSIILRGEEGYC